MVDAASKTSFVSIFNKPLSSQEELDSLIDFTLNQKFYKGKIFNDDGAITLLITIDKKILNSDRRDALMENLIDRGNEFQLNTNIKLHYAGLPYSRYTIANNVKDELSLLLVASLAVTALILFT